MPNAILVMFTPISFIISNVTIFIPKHFFNAREPVDPWQRPSCTRHTQILYFITERKEQSEKQNKAKMKYKKYKDKEEMEFENFKEIEFDYGNENLQVERENLKDLLRLSRTDFEIFEVVKITDNKTGEIKYILYYHKPSDRKSYKQEELSPEEVLAWKL